MARNVEELWDTIAQAIGAISENKARNIFTNAVYVPC
jgi:hypothetical protein